ncbi:MAG: hypothetical protein WBG08_09940 [Litorimonas sp.]
MRRLSTLLGSGAALLATPALAHHGEQGSNGTMHLLADHGLAAGIAGVAVIAVATILFLKRKG